MRNARTQVEVPLQRSERTSSLQSLADLLLLPLLPLLLLLPSLLLHIASVLCWLGRAHLAHSGQQHTLSLFSGAAERRA